MIGLAKLRGAFALIFHGAAASFRTAVSARPGWRHRQARCGGKFTRLAAGGDAFICQEMSHRVVLIKMLTRISNIAKRVTICKSCRKFVLHLALQLAFKRPMLFDADEGEAHFFSEYLQFKIALAILLTRISFAYEDRHEQSDICRN